VRVKRNKAKSCFGEQKMHNRPFETDEFSAQSKVQYRPEFQDVNAADI
jgi:hypothetical protein